MPLAMHRQRHHKLGIAFRKAVYATREMSQIALDSAAYVLHETLVTAYSDDTQYNCIKQRTNHTAYLQVHGHLSRPCSDKGVTNAALDCQQSRGIEVSIPLAVSTCTQRQFTGFALVYAASGASQCVDELQVILQIEFRLTALLSDTRIHTCLFSRSRARLLCRVATSKNDAMLAFLNNCE